MSSLHPYFQPDFKEEPETIVLCSFSNQLTNYYEEISSGVFVSREHLDNLNLEQKEDFIQKLLDENNG